MSLIFLVCGVCHCACAMSFILRALYPPLCVRYVFYLACAISAIVRALCLLSCVRYIYHCACAMSFFPEHDSSFDNCRYAILTHKVVRRSDTHFSSAKCLLDGTMNDI